MKVASVELPLPEKISQRFWAKVNKSGPIPEHMPHLGPCFEDFPKNHNLILLAQPGLLNKISLTVHEDIKSRITYSVLLQKLNPDDTAAFILAQLDRVRLPHNTFTNDALALIVRSSEGVLRKTRNLCLSCLLVAVRDQTKTIGLKQVNRVLLQPHWRV